MLTPQLRKFTNLYHNHGLSAVRNLHIMVQLLLIARTVNLWKLKDYVGLILGNVAVLPGSHYRRLTRFFDKQSQQPEFQLDIQRQVFKVLRRLNYTHLLLDGSSWKRGEQKYHYMVLSVLAGSVAIPIYWKQLEKIGSSSQVERKELFEEAMKYFDLSKMTLLADREYIGKEWFKYLRNKGINFVIRLRFADYYEAVDDQPGKTYQEMYDRCYHRGKFVHKQILIGGKAFYLSMRQNPKGTPGDEVIIFLTPIKPVRKTVDQYVKRWRIECLFRHLKTNGFDLEAINLQPARKSNLLMAIVCLAYAVTIRAAWNVRSTIRQIQFSDGSVYLAESVFRKGLSIITAQCGTFRRFVTYMITLLPTSDPPILKNVQ
jgi:hypothetical protein